MTDQKVKVKRTATGAPWHVGGVGLVASGDVVEVDAATADSLIMSGNFEAATSKPKPKAKAKKTKDSE